MAIEIFNRHENKYLIDESILPLIIGEFMKYMIRDIYNDNPLYQISNIYFDTENDDLINTSLSKPEYKEKLRIRAYGNVSLDSFVYIEIKKKYAGVVNKRRSKMLLSEAYDFLINKQMPILKDYMNKQVIKEIYFMINYYDLKPRLFMSYQRIAFFGIDNPDLRISFDSCAITRRDNLRLEDGVFGKNLLGPQALIMEIKVKDAIPLWLCKILVDYNLVATSFSKYGEEYRQNTLNSKRSTQYV